jgi:hypothetical protein
MSLRGNPEQVIFLRRISEAISIFPENAGLLRRWEA